MTIDPAYGEFTALVQMLKPDLGKEIQISILGGIVALYEDGKYFIGTIILLFSVLFPVWKLGVLWGNVSALARREELNQAFHRIEKLGKFSMLDIFVIAVLIVTLKGLPGGTEIGVDWGVFAFAASVLLSIPIPHWMHELANQQARS